MAHIKYNYLTIKIRNLAGEPLLEKHTPNIKYSYLLITHPYKQDLKAANQFKSII
jgi:hypothetical protein